MNSTLIIIEIILIILLVLLNAILSLAEIAIVSARRVKIQKAANEGDSRADVALELMDDPNQFLSTVQLGMTLVAIITGALGGSTLSEPLGAFLSPYIPYSYYISMVIVVVVSTYFTIIVGEIVPKRIAMIDPENMALKSAKAMKLINKICSPVVYILDLTTDLCLKILRADNIQEDVVTEEEVKLLIEEGIEDGTIEKEEESIIKRVFNLDDQKVDMIMTPRSEMIWLDLEDSDDENQAKIIESKRSIFPVASGELDDFIGVVQAKDILSSMFQGGKDKIEDIIKNPLVVPENMPSMELLKEFKNNRQYVHMALVVDEFGSVVGLITLNDLLEGIVGDIPGIDETDDPQAIQRKDGSWLIDGRFSIEDFKELFEIEDEMPQEVEDGFTTIAGFILSFLGKIPDTDESFDWENYSFEIIDMDGNHIDKILVTVNEIIDSEEDEEVNESIIKEA